MAVALEQQAMKSSLKHLISEMYKAEVKAYEKGSGDKPKPLPKAIQKEDAEEKKAEDKGKKREGAAGTKAPKVTEDMKKVIRGFFQPEKKKEENTVSELFVGKIKKAGAAPVVKTKRRRRKKA